MQIDPYLLELFLWFVPSLAENLLSTRLLDQLGFSTLIENDILICKRDLAGADWHKFANPLHGNLYCVYANLKSTIDSLRALWTREYSMLRMWHNHLRYQEFQVVGEMRWVSQFLANFLFALHVCRARWKLRLVLECYHKPFECIHSDLVPLDGISFGKSKHMLIFANNYTCFRWVYFTSSGRGSPRVCHISGKIMASIWNRFPNGNGSLGLFMNNIRENSHIHIRIRKFLKARIYPWISIDYSSFLLLFCSIFMFHL